MMRLLLTTLVLSLTMVGCKKPEPATPEAAAKPQGRRVELAVTEAGFEPASVAVKVGVPLELVVTRKTDATCATELLIDGTDINVQLPLDEAVTVAFTPSRTGTIKYGCAMDKMVSGVLVVD